MSKLNTGLTAAALVTAVGAAGYVAHEKYENKTEQSTTTPAPENTSEAIVKDTETVKQNVANTAADAGAPPATPTTNIGAPSADAGVTATADSGSPSTPDAGNVHPCKVVTDAINAKVKKFDVNSAEGQALEACLDNACKMTQPANQIDLVLPVYIGKDSAGNAAAHKTCVNGEYSGEQITNLSSPMVVNTPKGPVTLFSFTENIDGVNYKFGMETLSYSNNPALIEIAAKALTNLPAIVKHCPATRSANPYANTPTTPANQNNCYYQVEDNMDIALAKVQHSSFVSEPKTKSTRTFTTRTYTTPPQTVKPRPNLEPRVAALEAGHATLVNRVENVEQVNREQDRELTRIGAVLAERTGKVETKKPEVIDKNKMRRNAGATYTGN